MQTDLPTRREIEQLFQATGTGLVSIYLPTTPITPDADASRIELKNLAAQAMNELGEMHPAHNQRRLIEEELEHLVDDHEFWAQQGNSLAIFADSEHLQSFRLPNRLTAAVQVSDRFHVTPLLRTTTFPQAAFVLALAENSVRLFEVARDLPTEEIAVANLPVDARSVVARDEQRGSRGQEQGDRGRETMRRNFVRAVERALRPVLTGQELPLILAAAQPTDAVFRSVCTYPHLVSQALTGSPEHHDARQLGDEARGILDELYAEQLQALKDRFEAWATKGRTALDISDIARAADAGAIDTLIVDMDVQLPGTIDELGNVTLDAPDTPGAYGVIDELCRRVILTDGRVMAVRADDVPHGQPAAALLRYAAA
jgi:hypothetical protein